MGENNENKQGQCRIKPDDARLLRAARRIIRLYDLDEARVIRVKAESLAQIIAQELNHGAER